MNAKSHCRQIYRIEQNPGTKAGFARFFARCQQARARTMGQAANLNDFVVGFLDEGGALIRTMPMAAESVTVATSRAGEIASEIAAADFYITSKPLFPLPTAHGPG